MIRSIIILTFFLFLDLLFGQSGLRLKDKDKVFQLLSSQDKNLVGILSQPNFSPSSYQLFSFVRQLEDNRYLYLFHTPTRRLTEIKTVERKDQLEITLERYKPQTLVYNDLLDWCPELSKDGRQWFAFVSSGRDDNHDIYIGFVEGSNYIRLTTHPAIDSYPKWSPDGKSIAFISSRNGKGEIYLLKNLDKVMESRDASKAELVRLTQTREEELELSWNPNPESQLLAYSKRVRFPAQNVESFQIFVLDLLGDLDNPLVVTKDPLMHFTRPQWDPNKDNRLLYVGQSIEEDSPANLYISEFTWNEMKELRGRRLEGYGMEVFKNVRLSGTEAIWLTGGRAILCQEDKKERYNPIFSVNIDNWQRKRGQAAFYFEELHSRYPHISEYDIKDNVLLFSTQEGKFFKIFATQLAGNDISPVIVPVFALNNPKTKGTGIWSTIKKPYVWGSLASGAGAALYFILSSGGGGGGGGEGTPIGRPPSMPGGSK